MSGRPFSTWLGAGLLLAGAAALRFWRLGQAALWADEASNLHIASVPLKQLVLLMPHDAKPPLYYLLLHFWVAVFGNGEAAVRSLDALLGALTPLAVLLAGGVGAAAGDSLSLMYAMPSRGKSSKTRPPMRR